MKNTNAAAEAEKKTILLVEDEALIAMNTASSLQKYGYIVETVYSGEKALEIVEDLNIDLVLMDIDLGTGRMDGTEAAELILQNHDIPIVFLSSHSEPEIVERTEKITSYGYIAKTSGYTVLHVSIRTALQLDELNKRLKQQEIEATAVIDNVAGAVIRYNNRGKIVLFSKGAERMFGYTAKEIIGTDGVGLINPEIDSAGIRQKKLLDDIFRDPEAFAVHENENSCKDGSVKWMEWRNTAIYDMNGEIRYIQSVGIDRTEQKRAAEENELGFALLQTLTRQNSKKELIREITGMMQHWSGCQAVGVRLAEGDDFPYFETRGFPADFVESERHLCAYDEKNELLRDSEGNPVLECMCGNVIAGRFNPELPFFTEFGSFYTNSTTALLASTTEEDRQARTRNRCNGEGYESVALVPLRFGNEPLGLLQFNDPKPGLFTEGKIKTLERLAFSLVIGLKQIQVSESLRKSEKKYKLLTETSTELVCMHEPDGTYQYVSPSVAAILGYAEDELPGTNPYDLFHPEDIQEIEEQSHKVALSGGVIQGCEYRIRKKDGSYTWLQTSTDVVKNDAGEVIQLITKSHDISDRKQAEQALQESERQKKIILNSSHELIAYYDIDLRIQWTNRASAESVGKTVDELIGKHCYEIWQGRDEPCPGCPVLKAKETKKPEKLEQQTPDGRYWDLRGYPVLDDSNKLIGLVEFGQDISPQKRVQLALEASEQKFRAMIEQAGEMLFLHDLNGKIIDVNRAAVKSTGFSREELLQKYIFDIDPEAKDRHDMEHFWQGLTPADEPVSLEVHHRRKNGTVYIAEVTLSKVVLEDGEFIFALAKDVTERTLLQEKINYEQRLIDLFIETIPDRVFFKDLDSRFIKMNSAAVKHMGLDGPEHAIGKSDTDFYSEEFAEKTRRDELCIIETGIPIVNMEEHQHLKKGLEYWTLSSKYPLYDESGKIVGTFGISHDISELRRTAEELGKSVKEKEFLMKELNHRVKNNLLMITSLISLKESALEGKADLSDLRNQIDTIRIVHEKLYQTEQVESIALPGYFSDLLHTVFSNFTTRPVRIESNIENLTVPTKIAVPLGLIVNEMATNAIKHGFDGTTEAVFEIEFRKIRDEKAEEGYFMRISNSGKPLPEHVGFDHPETLGLRLMSALTGQLEGTIDVQRAPHPVFTFRFSI